MKTSIKAVAIVGTLVAVATGTAGETLVRVTDINPGSRGSFPSFLTVFNDQLFFRANTGLNNVELWRFDGTNAFLAAEINPGAEGSSPSYLAALGGNLYFDATTAAGQYRLHRFDGVNAVELNTNPKALFGSGSWKPVVWGNYLWFWSTGKLYQFNGTALSYLNTPPYANSEPVPYNGSLYYRAQESTFGDELWRFNGSVQQRVTDINPGAGDAYPEVLFEHQNALFFRARDGSHGNELWRYDGNAAQRVADINPGAPDANPSYFASYRNALYFAADDGVHGVELFCYDGNTVSLAADLNPNPIYEQGGDRYSDSNPRQLIVLGDVLYFIADNGTYGGLWRYDGTNAVVLGGGQANAVTELIVFQNTLYFDADDGVYGRELWQVATNAEPRLAIAPPTDGVTVQLEAAETGAYVLESSSDLSRWTAVQTNRPMDGQIFFNDAVGPDASVKIYRILKAE